MPCPILRLPELESENEGAKTLRLRVVVAVREPDMPVIVTVLWPGAAVLLVMKLSEVDPLVGLVAKEAFTPPGKPETARFTLPVKPY